MRARVVFDRQWDVFRVSDERGQVMADGEGYPLAFENRQDAEDMLQRRAELFALPVRPLKAHPGAGG